MPGSGDNGTCIGAAYCLYNQTLHQSTRYQHNSPYLGTSYSDDEIERLLRSCKLAYLRYEDICLDTAQLLREGKIIGWFQGRMEIGPRALGCRSILADPTIAGMKDKINAEVKHREPYRPFAPSCPTEHRMTYFDIEVEDPFMLKVCNVRKEMQEKIPAITHVDGTARLQTVDPQTNPLYHRMINEFGKLSGIPVVLNTSFNIMGEPIVESPTDAIRCFFSTGLDVLVIGSFIVRKT
jgi:carbamoyltransferase